MKNEEFLDILRKAPGLAETQAQLSCLTNRAPES